jgi:hypothetical protein
VCHFHILAMIDWGFLSEYRRSAQRSQENLFSRFIPYLRQRLISCRRVGIIPGGMDTETMTRKNQVRSTPWTDMCHPCKSSGSGGAGASAALALLDDVHRNRLRRAALHLPARRSERGPS